MRPLTGSVLLAIARVLLGLLFLVRTTPLSNLVFNRLAFVHGPLLGWPEPGWSFAWGGWVLPAPVVAAACVLRTGAAITFVLGVRARVAGLIAGGCGLLVLSQDAFGFIFTLYTLFLGVLLLALTDATATLALVPDRPVSVPSSLFTVRAFVTSIYAWAGLAKLHSAWLSGEVLSTLKEDGILSGWLIASATATHERSAITASAVGAGELLLAVLLWVPKTRRIAPYFAIVFHLALEAVAHPDVISWVLLILLLPLLEWERRPELCRRIVSRDDNRG